MKRPIVWSHACRHSGKPVEASEKKRPRFRARKGRSLVFGPAQSLLDVLLTELYFLLGCVCRLSAITREPCRSLKQLPGHRLQAAS